MKQEWVPFPLGQFIIQYQETDWISFKTAYVKIQTSQ